MLDDLRVDPCVQSGSSDDFLEQPRIDSTRTRKSDQYSTGSQQFECIQVDIFVSPRGSFSLRSSRCKLRWVKNDHIERTILIAEFAQKLKNIAFDESRLINRRV